MINFKITGEGALIGVGNGDPNCHESDKEPRRSLFNGLAQAIVQSTKTPEAITIEASTIVRDKTVAPATVTVMTKAVNPRPTVA
jgi:beta-galactosidase